MPVIPVTPAIPNTSALDIITNALMEMGALAQSETPSAGDSSFALSKLNRMLDQWNARRLFIFSVNFASYVLHPNLQPHTIGPAPQPGGATPTFQITQTRPAKIVAANIILNNSTPTVRNPLNIRDDQWWAQNQVRDVTTTVPTDLYYSPDWPLGNIFLWPVPTIAYGLELESWVNLQRFVLADKFSMPPGYEEAVTLSLAESLCPGFGRPVDTELAKGALRARSIITGLNGVPPQMATKDSGIPTTGNRGVRSDFNYLTGRVG